MWSNRVGLVVTSTRIRADRYLMNTEHTSSTLLDPAPFYWELSADEQRDLHAANLILEDEGYLAHDINRGRHLMDVSDDYVPVPDVASDWQPPQRAETFSDAISAILQVAADAGFDPEDLVSAALFTQGAIRSHSARAIRRE